MDSCDIFIEGVRAVGFVNSPLLPAVQNGRNVTDLIHVTDWLPTMLGIAGGSIGNLTLDGINQWNTFKEGSASTRTVNAYEPNLISVDLVKNSIDMCIYNIDPDFIRSSLIFSLPVY